MEETAGASVDSALEYGLVISDGKGKGKNNTGSVLLQTADARTAQAWAHAINHNARLLRQNF
jgi:hypothetical protein